MRAGRKFPDKVWCAFQKQFASDNNGLVVDKRHREPKFRRGAGLAIYWETLSRWMSQRCRRDAYELQVPLVFPQAADECNTIDRDAYCRLLNVPNMHNTGNIHGVLPAHEKMRVRFMVKVNSALGLVQEQRGTIVSFLFHDEDRLRYQACGPGDIFRPRRLPAAILLQVDDFTGSPTHAEMFELMSMGGDLGPDGLPFCCGCCEGVVKFRARGLYWFSPVQCEFTWRSSEDHQVKRTGFPLTHADYMTCTASQGQTIRTGVTIDCARTEATGSTGMSDENWWLNLYVMFSRATRMEDMLILRPPERKFLEAGPPRHLRDALQRFEQKIAESSAAAAALAADLGIPLPP